MTIQKRFTDTWVRSADRVTDKLTAYTDPGNKGLCLRVMPTGIRTWYFVFRSRITGKVEFVKIGRYPEVSLEQAAAKVRDGWKLVADGKPVEFATTKKNDEDTVDQVLARYDAEWLASKRTRYNIRTSLAALIRDQKWGSLPLATLTRSIIKVALLKIMKDGKPTQAYNCQVMFSTFLNWATEEGIIPANPIRGMKSVGITSKRARWLNEDEIRQLWDALHRPADFGLSQCYADALLLLLVTTARSGMICRLRDGILKNTTTRSAKAEIVEDGDGRLLADFTAADMKMGRPFVLPFNALATGIIQRRQGSGFLFPMVQKKRQPIIPARLSAACIELSKRLGWTAEGEDHGSPFHPQDLRRTGATLLRKMKPAHRVKYTRDEVGQLLSHETTGSKVMEHYDVEDRWDHLEEKRELADWLGACITRIVSSQAAIRRVA